MLHRMFPFTLLESRHMLFVWNRITSSIKRIQILRRLVLPYARLCNDLRHWRITNRYLSWKWDKSQQKLVTNWQPMKDTPSLQETARERGIDSWVLAPRAATKPPPRSPGTALVHSYNRNTRTGGHLDIIPNGSGNESGQCSSKCF